MTKEEAIEEINKVFVPSFANYIITALTEGTTVSDTSSVRKSKADLIDQLEILDKRYGSDFYWEVRKIVDRLASATPTQQWNTTPPTTNTHNILLSAETEDAGPRVWMGCYVDGHYYYIDGIVAVDDEVVAWMPLPTPYKAERREIEE